MHWALPYPCRLLLETAMVTDPPMMATNPRRKNPPAKNLPTKNPPKDQVNQKNQLNRNLPKDQVNQKSQLNRNLLLASLIQLMRKWMKNAIQNACTNALRILKSPKILATVTKHTNVQKTRNVSRVQLVLQFFFVFDFYLFKRAIIGTSVQNRANWRKTCLLRQVARF